MHVMIINGSPRIEKHSNTARILDAFCAGLEEKGVTYERYAVSNRKSWEDIREAYINNKEVLIAMPLFVECAPGMLLEFLETLPKKTKETRLSFLLQGGFAEGCQFRCGEAFLEKLPDYLGCSYGGTLVKGDNFAIRVLDASTVEKITGPYKTMGSLFAEGDGFQRKEARRFTGPERYSWPMRAFLQFLFKTKARSMYAEVAADWGCTEPLDKKTFTEESA